MEYSKEIDKKWQEKWKKEGLYKYNPNSEKEKFYTMEMFSYPSGAKLHLVYPLGFSISEKAVKRAGLDYWDKLDIEEHSSLEKFLGQVSDACLRAIILDISEIPIPDEISQQAFEDYCRIILVDLPEMIRKEKIEKEIEEAERNHNYIRAAELVQELAKKNAGVLIPMKN